MLRRDSPLQQFMGPLILPIVDMYSIVLSKVIVQRNSLSSRKGNR